MNLKLNNPLKLLFIACVMFATTGCGDSAKQEETKSEAAPAATETAPAAPAKPDSIKDSLPKVDTSNTPRPDTKKT